MAIPMRQVSQLSEDIGRLNYQYALTGRIDQLLWQRLKRECERLCKLGADHALGAYQIEAALYALVGRREMMLATYGKAERLLPSSPALMAEKANNAHRVGLVSVATDLLREVMSLSPREPDVLVRVCKLALGVGLYHSALEAVKCLHTLQRADLICDEEADIVKSIALMEQYGATEDDVNQRIAYAYEILFQRFGKAFSGFRHSVTAHGLALEITLNEPAEALVDADWEIAEQMVAHFDDPLDALITLSSAPCPVVDPKNVHFI